MPVYLWLNICTILFPLALSFDRKVAYVKKWKYLFPAILMTALIFIVWDYFFTLHGVWEFNDAYLCGLYILGMPIEEWLFFITVPYASVFIYACLKAYVKFSLNDRFLNIFFPLFALILIAGGLIFNAQLYTFINFGLAGIFTLIAWRLCSKRVQSYFLLAYLIHLIPFILINGLLTFLPIVIYNNLENIGLRVISIPVEDFIYSYLLLYMNVFFYEKLQTLYPNPQPARAKA